MVEQERKLYGESMLAMNRHRLSSGEFRLSDEVLRHLQNLQTVRTVDKAITSSHYLDITLNMLLTHVLTQLGADAADVLLLEAGKLTLGFSAGKGFRIILIDRAVIHLSDET